MVGRFFILLAALVVVCCSDDDDGVVDAKKEPMESSSSSWDIIPISSSSSLFVEVSSSSVAEAKNLLQADLLKMATKNTEVYVGTNLESAWVKDRPQMKVLLSYDYSLGKHEVTCGEYNAVISSPEAGLQQGVLLKCENE